MAGSPDRMWESAVQMGLQNRETIELARRHCLDMEFTQSGGRGMAEEATGLPINMRQIRCPVALGSMSANLLWIATDFYKEHCIGCARRRPTGDVPNLATMVEEATAAAAAARAEQDRRLLQEQADWKRRVDDRRSLGASSGEAMAGVLRDIDILDFDPAAPTTSEELEGARNRVSALADRAPQLFTTDVIATALHLVATGHAYELLDPLRRLARGRPDIAADTAQTAVASLRAGHPVWAGPCLAELIEHIDVQLRNEEVCRPLVMRAGAPALDRLGHSRPNRSNDPTGLQAVAASPLKLCYGSYGPCCRHPQRR